MKTLSLIAPLGKAGLVGQDINFRLPCLGSPKVAALTPPGWEGRVLADELRLSPVRELVLARTPPGRNAHHANHVRAGVS